MRGSPTLRTTRPARSTTTIREATSARLVGTYASVPFAPAWGSPPEVVTRNGSPVTSRRSAENGRAQMV